MTELSNIKRPPHATAVIILSDGSVFWGRGIGAENKTIGEICFNTSMTGYQEILTDPSYSGQLITMTYPHIGNYGINLEDCESNKIQASGLIIREENIIPSNYRSTKSLGNYLLEENIVGIQEIDTRMLTRMIRDEGAMNGIISTISLDKESLLLKVNSAPSMNGMDLAKVVTCAESYVWKKETEERKQEQSGNGQQLPVNFKIAAINYGIKHNILRLLQSYGCDITVFPADVTAKEILDFNPDGVFLSNGPGDPAAVTYGIETVKGLLGEKPIFGICLGHQILALALGAKTYKLKFGHRGINHPVKNVYTGAVSRR